MLDLCFGSVESLTLPWFQGFHGSHGPPLSFWVFLCSFGFSVCMFPCQVECLSRRISAWFNFCQVEFLSGRISVRLNFCPVEFLSGRISIRSNVWTHARTYAGHMLGLILAATIFVWKINERPIKLVGAKEDTKVEPEGAGGRFESK